MDVVAMVTQRSCVGTWWADHE